MKKIPVTGCHDCEIRKRIEYEAGSGLKITRCYNIATDEIITTEPVDVTECVKSKTFHPDCKLEDDDWQRNLLEWNEIKEFIPINIRKTKEKWESIYSIPNGRWNSIEAELKAINIRSIPVTARIFMFNHLPHCIMKIILAGNTSKERK